MVMVILLICLVIGAGTGYLFREKNIFKRVSLLTEITVGILLILLGASIGMNDFLLNNLGSLGLDALLLAGGAVVGSILAVTPVYFLFFRGKE